MSTAIEREAVRRLREIAPTCTLVAPAVFDDPVRRCNLDGTPLPLTKAGGASLTRRWCSARCEETFWHNHGWTRARWFAIARARLPLVSGIARHDIDGLIAEVSPDHRYLPVRCERCFRKTTAPEVNHVEPRNGGGYGNGCHHHQTNLEVLCHPCHVAETTRQVRERRGIPPEGRVREARSDEVLPEPLWGAA